MTNNFFYNKKADERYLSPWMFLIWCIIGVSIIIGVIQFYSVLADARVSEANTLNVRILDCLSQDFNYAAVSSMSFDIYAKCNLNKDVLESKNDYYYFNASIKDSSGKILYSIAKGVLNFDVMCKYGKIEPNFAQCKKQSLHVKDASDGKDYVLELTTASNQK